MNNSENIISKEEVIKICTKELKKVKAVGYTNDFIKALDNNINNVTEIDSALFFHILGRFPADSDIADYFSYKFDINDEKIKKDDIVKILEIPENQDDVQTVDGLTFRWNARKSMINKLKHGYYLNEAIGLLMSTDKKLYNTKNNRTIAFNFVNDNIFAAVEIILEEGKTFRILSYRMSNRKEWEEYAEHKI